ncbi:hypothetical protein AMAG_10442 [Allomyces macrogynus ATCC 38327]|uniref:GRIP domain-containing protein n=1 Tax=Allomyces macrogynus (strain ATCC 38327) TaxID=578462 RepID=A0A0L0SUR0_ALLM3|nr:hypothetical protein AMAG_10442 [Allomyces macrogynus ATCC 38327]|eukprot:KNE66201.1 hypothetical protein AMAG_10442 [Allomyces macrogynus ATCC 38327]
MLLRTRVKRGLASAQAALTLATGPLMAASSSASPSTQASPVDDKPSSSILAVAAEGFRPLLSRTDEQDESVSVSEHPLSDSASSAAAPDAAANAAAAVTIQQLQDLVRAMQRKMDDINMEKESWRQQYFAAIDQIASKPVVKSADAKVGPDTDEMDAKVREVEAVHAEVVNGLRDEIDRLQTDLKAAQTAADAAKCDQRTEQDLASSLANQLASLKEQHEQEVTELKEQLQQAESRTRSALPTPIESTPSPPELDHGPESPDVAPAPTMCAAAIQTDSGDHADGSIEPTPTRDALLQTDPIDSPLTARSVIDAILQTDPAETTPALTDVPLTAPAAHATSTQTDDDSGLPNPEAIQALEKLLVVQHEQDLAAVRQEHARSLDQLTRQHERVVADLREELARDMEVQAKKHEWSVMEVRRRVRDEHAAQLDAVERAHVEAVGKVREEAAREQAVAEEEHAQAMAAVRVELRQVQQKGEEFQERLRIYETQMRTLADESRDAALLRDQVQKLTAALLSAEARAAATLKDSEERVAEHQAAHDTVKLLLDQRSAHCAQLETTVAGMTNDLAHLKADLETASAASAQAASDVATARTALAVHRRDLSTATRRIAELEAQIDSERAALAEAVARAEASAAGLRAQFTAVEEYAQNLAAEVQRARAEREEALRAAENAREEVQRAHEQVRRVEAHVVEMQHQIIALEAERDRARELDATIVQLHGQITRQAREIEDLQTREMQYKNVNKSLKDELRKLATRTASLPGTPTKSVGSPRSMHSELSWPPAAASTALTAAATSSGHEGAASFRSASPSRSPLLTNAVRGHHAAGWPGGPALAGDVREVNVTYLKSVLWSFLEKRTMRTQLIPVLRALLACTEDEMRRLQAAVDQQGAAQSFLPSLFS